MTADGVPWYQDWNLAPWAYRNLVMDAGHYARRILRLPAMRPENSTHLDEYVHAEGGGGPWRWGNEDLDKFATGGRNYWPPNAIQLVTDVESLLAEQFKAQQWHPPGFEPDKTQHALAEGLRQACAKREVEPFLAGHNDLKKPFLARFGRTRTFEAQIYGPAADSLTRNIAERTGKTHEEVSNRLMTVPADVQFEAAAGLMLEGAHFTSQGAAVQAHAKITETLKENFEKVHTRAQSFETMKYAYRRMPYVNDALQRRGAEKVGAKAVKKADKVLDRMVDRGDVSFVQTPPPQQYPQQYGPGGAGPAQPTVMAPASGHERSHAGQTAAPAGLHVSAQDAGMHAPIPGGVQPAESGYNPAPGRQPDSAVGTRNLVQSGTGAFTSVRAEDVPAARDNQWTWRPDSGQTRGGQREQGQ